MKITISHEFAVDAETFWARCFLDESFNRALYVESLRFPVYEVLEAREEGPLVHRKVRVAPKADAPAAVEKMLGGAFSYIEQGALDRAANAYRFKILPSTMQDKIRAEGVFRLEKTGPKLVRRVVELTIEVKVFGIGGLAEGFVSRAMQDTYGRAAEFTARYLREQGL